MKEEKIKNLKVCLSAVLALAIALTFKFAKAEGNNKNVKLPKIISGQEYPTIEEERKYVYISTKNTDYKRAYEHIGHYKWSDGTTTFNEKIGYMLDSGELVKHNDVEDVLTPEQLCEKFYKNNLYLLESKVPNLPINIVAEVKPLTNGKMGYMDTATKEIVSNQGYYSKTLMDMKKGEEQIGYNVFVKNNPSSIFCTRLEDTSTNRKVYINYNNPNEYYQEDEILFAYKTVICKETEVQKDKLNRLYILTIKETGEEVIGELISSGGIIHYHSLDGIDTVFKAIDENFIYTVKKVIPENEYAYIATK